MKQKDPTIEKLSNGCMWLLFAIIAIVSIAVVSGMAVRIFFVVSGL